MQDKTSKLEKVSVGIGLKVNKRKTELMRINTKVVTPITVGEEPPKDVKPSTYLGSNLDV